MEQLPRLHSQTRSSSDNPGVRTDSELTAERFVHETKHYLRVCAVVLVFGGHPKKVVSRLRICRHFSTEGETRKHGFVVVDVCNCDLNGHLLRPSVIPAPVRRDDLEVVDALLFMIEQPVTKKQYTELRVCSETVQKV